MFPCVSAWRMSARLLMLFDAGSLIVACNVRGGCILYCMVVVVYGLFFLVCAAKVYYFTNLGKQKD